MCVVTLSDKLTAPVLTRLLFSALMILIVDHRRRRDLKLTPAHTCPFRILAAAKG